MEPIEPQWNDPKISALDRHTRNFIEAVKANKPSMLATPIESGSLAAINAQMGNIAFRTGQKLHWDAELGQFMGNEQANQLAQAQYHNGWKLQ